MHSHQAALPWFSADANRVFCSAFCCAVHWGGCLKCFQDGKHCSFFSLPPCSLPGRFSFFSRDKKRMQASQKNVHFQQTFGEWSHSNRDDSYMEQGQEALQHLWPKPWGVWFAAVDLDSLVPRSFCKASRQLVTSPCLAHLGGYCRLQKGSLTVHLVTVCCKQEPKLCSNSCWHPGTWKLLDDLFCAE